MSRIATALLDKLVTPVILMVLGFLGTWVFSINSDMAIMKQSINRVDAVVVDQRAMERMVTVLEIQNKNTTELAQEIKSGQKELSATLVELKISLSRIGYPVPNVHPAPTIELDGKPR